MIRFVLLLTFKPETPPGERDAVVARIEALPSRFGQIRSWQVNVNRLDGLERYTDLAVIGDFENAGEFMSFMDDPAHKAVGAELAPALAAISRCAFEVP